ncbi:MAG: U32 family peptidase [Planctomycetes bacterium]|nr:U32 family peptidase [Planctomycetota bacterium]
MNVPILDTGTGAGSVELLAPAGGPEAAWAALHFGADAVYLGLKKFSARAEAENFTLAELDEITAYAHSLTPPRRVFVTVNTLIRQDELPELIEDLAALEDIGVDAVILQDLGVYGAIKKFFPRLELHGSTQMSVHNRAGAEALRRLGFTRVVLARELTFEEARDITGAAGIETEVFVHGALCYAYSGLCLFSAQTLGRSGNRGKCAYSCRDAYEVTGAPQTLRDGGEVKRDPRAGFPFSMKDLALPDHLPALRAAGVSCFKIEGRKKSPLYVATTTDYYRRLLDGRLDGTERPNIEADLQTVFSRPWTRLFVQSAKDKEVADRDTVGHRGARIGYVEAVLYPSSAKARLRFRTARRLERHDGLQIDLPILGKPVGFAVDHLWAKTGRKAALKEAITAAAGTLVEVSLPAEHPQIPVGAPVYCSSSQEVKQRYRHDRPKPGQFRTRLPIHFEATLTSDALTVTALSITKIMPGPFPKAHDPEAMEGAVRAAFERLGDSRFALASLTWKNEIGGFVPVSRLNQLRRELIAQLEKQFDSERVDRVRQIQQEIAPFLQGEAGGAERPNSPTTFAWSLKIDRLGFLDAFEERDWQDIDELVIDIARDHPAVLRARLESLGDRVGRNRIRFALPALTRAWEEKSILHKIDTLREAGWHKWEAANLSAWTYLSDQASLNLSTDWSVYVLNRLAALQLIDMGVSRFALSPEDGIGNWRSLLGEFGPRAVLIVHQDTPLFLAESCAYANLIGGCPGKANCRFESMEMVSSHGEKVTALDYHCRTIVLNQGPYCLSTKLKELAAAGAVSLRADFIYRNYQPAEVRERWRVVRAGRPIPGGHHANFKRGIL